MENLHALNLGKYENFFTSCYQLTTRRRASAKKYLLHNLSTTVVATLCSTRQEYIIRNDAQFQEQIPIPALLAPHPILAPFKAGSQSTVTKTRMKTFTLRRCLQIFLNVHINSHSVLPHLLIQCSMNFSFSCDHEIIR